MSEWTDDDRARFEEAKRIIKSGDVEALAVYLSGCTPEKLDNLGGFSTEQRDCVTHHYCDCTADRIRKLVEKCDRLLSANDTPECICAKECPAMEHDYPPIPEDGMVTDLFGKIADLTAERDGLRNGNRDLHEECQRLRRERDDAINERKLTVALANEDYAEKAYQANRYEQALRRIAADDTSVYNADGTYSIGTDALIQIAADALNDHTDSE